jgi:hypothetical protein
MNDSQAHAELHAALFCSSAILVAAGINQGAYWQAAVAALIFVFWVGWQEGTAERRRRPPR